MGEDGVVAAAGPALRVVVYSGAYSVANCSQTVSTTSLHSASLLTNGRYCENCTELASRRISSWERPRDGRPDWMTCHFCNNLPNVTEGAVEGGGDTQNSTDRITVGEERRTGYGNDVRKSG